MLNHRTWWSNPSLYTIWWLCIVRISLWSEKTPEPDATGIAVYHIESTHKGMTAANEYNCTVRRHREIIENLSWKSDKHKDRSLSQRSKKGIACTGFTWLDLPSQKWYINLNCHIWKVSIINTQTFHFARSHIQFSHFSVGRWHTVSIFV